MAITFPDYGASGSWTNRHRSITLSQISAILPRFMEGASRNPFNILFGCFVLHLPEQFFFFYP